MYVGPDGNGDRDKWYQYTHPDDPTGSNEGMFQSIGNDIKFAMTKMGYNFRNGIKDWMKKSEKGDEVFAIGNPDGLESSVSSGIISSV
jgi:hypothetical protein